MSGGNGRQGRDGRATALVETVCLMMVANMVVVMVTGTGTMDDV